MSAYITYANKYVIKNKKKNNAAGDFLQFDENTFEKKRKYSDVSITDYLSFFSLYRIIFCEQLNNRSS
jgi:hypothetical protein